MNRRIPDTLSSLDLLPVSYRRSYRARQVRRSWFTVMIILVAVLFAVLAKSMHSAHCRYERNTKLGWAALPIRQLRQDVIALQSRNRLRREWCNLVDSAKPDDCALQTMVAIATTLKATDRTVLIDTFRLRLPVESCSPTRGLASLSIDFRARDLASRRNWLNRLEKLDRIEGLAVDQQSKTPGQIPYADTNGLQHSQLSGIPVATRVLP